VWDIKYILLDNLDILTKVANVLIKILDFTQKFLKSYIKLKATLFTYNISQQLMKQRNNKAITAGILAPELAYFGLHSK